MTRIINNWVSDPAVRGVIEMLQTAGYEAHFVGGCVRNALMDAPASDIDIATDATPEQVIGAANRAGLVAKPTGIDHGTVTVLSAGQPFEITTYRRDIETDGRHATVSFGTDLAEDAARRDFTMNALYATGDGVIVDPLGGLSDLQARRVRFIGNPEDRIREDYLRILRYFRFHAWYADTGQGFDPDALAAIAVTLDGLDTLSRERVGAEMAKLLAARDPAPELATMSRTGVLMRVLPGADPSGVAPLVHLEEETETPPDPVRRLAVLGGEDVQERLRLSKADERQRLTIRDGVGAGRSLAEDGYRFGFELGRDIVLARAALMSLPMPDDWRAEIEMGSEARFPLKAADLMPSLEGAELGRRLSDLEARWIASGFTLSREDLLGR